MGTYHGSCGRITLFGIPVDALTVSQTIDIFHQMIESRQCHLVFNLNVDICMQLIRNQIPRDIYHGADLILVDGTPMMWAARLLGTPLPARVSGSDFVPAFCSAAASRGYRLFFLGARPGVAKRASELLTRRHPTLKVVGTYAPPLGFEHDVIENTRVIERVRGASPDVLFVALGAPKEQLWLRQYQIALGVPVSMGIGSSLDYLAGRLMRAPVWMQRAGLEWLYRLAQEPRRLWRRYLIDDPPFAYYLLREMIQRRPRTKAGGKG